MQVSGVNLARTDAVALDMAGKIRQVKGVNDLLIPQDLDYPALRIDVDRESAGQLGLNQKEIVDNVITALNSNAMIAPSYWVDPRTGNDYLLTVQYAENQVKSLNDLKQIPLRAAAGREPTNSSTPWSSIKPMESPTEVDHYQLRRAFDSMFLLRQKILGGVTKSD